MTATATLDHPAFALIGRMRGADLYVVTVMYIAHFHLGADTVTPQWIRSKTSYSQPMVTVSLARLKEWLLTEQVQRYHWRLTAAGRQLPLPFSQLSTARGELSTDVDQIPPLTRNLFESAGSSSSDQERSDSEDQLKPLPLPVTRKDFESDFRDDIRELLVAPLLAEGCSRQKVTDAIAAALHRGETVRSLAEKIVAGRRYIATRPRGMLAPGYWLAACLHDGRAIPATPRTDALDLSGYDGYQSWSTAGSQEVQP